MYKIIAEWKNGESEVVDETEDEEEVAGLVAGYQFAFAAGIQGSKCVRVFCAEE